MAEGMDCDDGEQIQEFAPTGLQEVVGHPAMKQREAGRMWSSASQCEMQTPPTPPFAWPMQNPSSSSTCSGVPTAISTAHGIAKERDMTENAPPLCDGVNGELLAEKEVVTDEQWRGGEHPTLRPADISGVTSVSGAAE